MTDFEGVLHALAAQQVEFIIIRPRTSAAGNMMRGRGIAQLWRTSCVLVAGEKRWT